LFAVPWYNKVILGTTDSLVDKPSLEPRASDEDIDFILNNAGQYLLKQPLRKDILSVFSGLRPLAAPEEGEDKATKEISRSHKVLISVSGLITIIGGKWTIYRKMAEDTIEKAIMVGELPERKCITHHLLIHGYNINNADHNDPMTVYGLDRIKIQSIEEESDKFKGYLSESLQIRKAQIIWAVREEMARSVEDVLARRTRALFLDVKESLRIAPETAQLMADELNRDSKWVDDQLDRYNELAKGYFASPVTLNP
jgi:glycerol-3-phosphate dehydrogenase